VTPKQAVAFVKKHGVVLESASGPVPSLAQTIAGGKIDGSWWSHPMSKEIFRITRSVRESPQVLVCRLVSGKVTFVHERLWPALVCAGKQLGLGRVSQLVGEHTSSGKHLSREVPFPVWVPEHITVQAGKLSEEKALKILDSIIPGVASGP
jgi:hypothetical protein